MLYDHSCVNWSLIVLVKKIILAINEEKKSNSRSLYLIFSFEDGMNEFPFTKSRESFQS